MKFLKEVVPRAQRELQQNGDSLHGDGVPTWPRECAAQRHSVNSKRGEGRVEPRGHVRCRGRSLPPGETEEPREAFPVL